MLAELGARVERLEAENAELRRRLGLNSTNSSKPPSSDGLGRQTPKPKGGGSGRRRGKQPGSSGSALDLVAVPDHAVVHRPQRCVNPVCGADLGDAVEYGRQRRQVFEMSEPKLVVTEHQVVALVCGCGQVSQGAAPVGVTGRAQYGPGVKAAAVYGRGAQFLPFARVSRLLGDRGAHLIRDLRAVHEADPAGQQWAEVMADTLLMAKTMTEQAVAAGSDPLTDAEISHIRACYAGAVAYGRRQNPPNRNGEVSRAGKLAERFHLHRGMILRFAVDLAVPFTNNQAERDLRPVKLQQKISGTWRTLQGLADFAAVRSYLSTAAKHGLDALDVLKQLFTTGPWMPAAPSS
jgi:transposase